MKLKNIKDHFCFGRHLLLPIALYSTQQNWKCLHVRNRHYKDFHISNFWNRRSLGRKPFSPLEFDVQTNSDHKTQKIKPYSVRALKRYLNEKNLIHGRVMATISKFSPQIFETYFSCVEIITTASTIVIINKLSVTKKQHSELYQKS